MSRTTTITQLEDRYCVLKVRDVSIALTAQEKYLLLGMIAKCKAYRQLRGAQPLDGMVVESDWPEYEPTRAALLARLNTAAEAAADIPH